MSLTNLASLVCHVLSKNTDVFESLGELTGHYTIHTNPDVQPVVHPPCKLPISLQDTIKAELNKLVETNVKAPVTEPTPWVSSMVVVQKNNKLRICLDPRDLNKAIQRSHFSLPIIEQVAAKLNKAKVFTV